MDWKSPIIVLCLCLISACAASGSVHLIRPDGTGDFPTIQEAIDSVAPGDTIDLADGVFTGPGNRDLHTDGRSLTIRSQSGDSTACVIDCEGTPSSPHRAFQLYRRADPEVRLERFTIRNGYAPSGPAGPVGGAIDIFHASPILAGMVFEKNQSPRWGGAVNVEESSTVFEDCAFVGNDAGYSGGGICTGQLSGVTIARCRFTGNHSDRRGGGLALQMGNATVSDCTFRGNTAELMGGGIACEAAGSPRIERCVISGNQASNLGGGVGIVVGGPTFYECLIYDNSAPGGGGVACEQAPGAWFTRCTVSHNLSTSGSGFWMDRSAVYLEKCIVSFGAPGSAFACFEDVACDLTCCDVYGSEGGDYVGCIADQFGENGNIAEDPLFCDADQRDFRLAEESPCAPDFEPGCGRMGSQHVGCSLTGIADQTPGRQGLRILPNPTVGRAEILFQGAGVPCAVRIHDAAGRLVRTLPARGREDGSSRVVWNGRDDAGRPLPRGIYLCRVACGRIEEGRVVLLH